MKLFKTLLLVLAVSLTLYAEPAHNEQVLTNNGGDAVAMTSEYAVVGDVDRNSLYFYKLDYSDFQWKLDALFQDNLLGGSSEGGNLGYSVAIDGDIAVAGSPLFSNARIFRIRGGNNKDFDEYDIGSDTWIPLAPTPNNGGNNGGGSALAWTEIITFVLKGQSKILSGYVHADDTWQSRTDTPEKVGNGAAMVFNNDRYLYVMRGDNTDTFWTYDIYVNTWDIRASMPGPIDYGGSLTIANNGFTYALQGGGKAGFYVSNTGTGIPTSWSSVPLVNPIPNVGAGGALVSDSNNNIYILIGNGTPHLYTYNTVTGGLIQLPDAPGNVTKGGAMTFDGTSIYVQQGDTGTGYWRYEPLRETWTVLTGAANATGGGGALTMAPQAAGRGVVDVYERNATAVSPAPNWNRTLRISLSTPVSGDRFGHAVSIQNNGNGKATLLMGAPGRTSFNPGIGHADTHEYDSATVPSSGVLTMTPQTFPHPPAKSFGSAVDIKGGNIIVADANINSGDGQVIIFPSENDINGTNTEHFGTKVAINKDGNVSMIAGASSSYIYTYDGSWSKSQEQTNRDGGGVDIDDGVYFMAQKAGHLHYDIHADGSNRPLIILPIERGDFTSVTLYKEQSIVNDPTDSQAVAIDVPCGIKPTYLIANEWAMISVPCGDGSATPADIFGDELGTYGDNDNWVMHEQDGSNYNGTSASMVLVNSTAPMVLGKGYWIIADKNATLKADGDSVVGTGITTRTALDTTDATAEIAGFHDFELPAIAAIDDPKKVMVGNPFPRRINWVDTQRGLGGTNLKGSIDGTYINTTAFVYDNTSITSQPYRAITQSTPGFPNTMEAYQGFWIQVETPSYDISAGTLHLNLAFEK